MKDIEIIELLGRGDKVNNDSIKDECEKLGYDISPNLFRAIQYLEMVMNGAGGIGSTQDGKTTWVEIHFDASSRLLSKDEKGKCKIIEQNANSSLPINNAERLSTALVVELYRFCSELEDTEDDLFSFVHDNENKIIEFLREYPFPEISLARKSWLTAVNTNVSPIMGNFTLLETSSISKTPKSGSQLNKIFDLKKELSPEEIPLVPMLGDDYIPGGYEYDIAQDVYTSNGGLRNFMLAGPSGTGKTETAKAVAASLNVPYITFVCETGTDTTKLFCNFIPNTDELPEEKTVSNEKAALSSLGYRTKEELTLDADMDPISVYERLTGKTNETPTSDDVQLALNKYICNFRSETNLPKPNTAFRYVESPIVTAFRHGYVLEIQEPTTIKDPAVLTELNDVMTKKGDLRIPFTGEVVKRHPDTVVIYTTNMGYIGCRPMNQSVIDRIDVCHWVENIPEESVIARIQSQADINDIATIKKMTKAMSILNNHLSSCGEVNGIVGIRSMIAWAKKYKVTQDLLSSCITTVISKASMDFEVRNELQESVTAIL